MLEGYPRRSSSFPPDMLPLNSLPISAGLKSILLILETLGSFFALRASNSSLRMSTSPAKFMSAMSFHTMTVSEMPFRDAEFRMLISLDARKLAA